MAQSAGADPGQLQRLMAQLERSTCDLEALARALALEFGRVGCDPVAHNPEQLPTFLSGTLAAAAEVTLDLELELGKPSNRGHLANTGAASLTLFFQASAGDNWSDSYTLLSSAVLDFSSFLVRKIRVVADPTTGSSYQVLAQ